MSSLPIDLSDLVRSIEQASDDPLARVSDARRRANALENLGDQLIGHFVDQARSSNASWRQIGDALGVSKQAAQQRGAPGPFERFTARARHVVVIAEDRAHALRSSSIGTEHLLLGVAAETEGLGAMVLTKLSGSPIEAAVMETIVAGTENPPHKIPFRPESKEVIEHAMRQSRDLGHEFVGTEHVLLALLTVRRGTAFDILERAEVRYDPARAEVLDYFAQHKFQ